MQFATLYVSSLFGMLTLSASACELCAIYKASNAQGEFSRGFLFSASEQFTHFGTERFGDMEIKRDFPDFLDSSMSHVVLGYDFSPRFGLSFSLPVVYRSFRRSDVRFSLNRPPVFATEEGTVSGIGDAALVGRFTVFAKRTMASGIVVNLLGGVKFPTGATDRLKDEVEQDRIFTSLLPPGTPHDPVEHSVSSVHQHDLSLGSGSFDGVFGLTLNTRWQRWFFNAQFQYSLRTEGESSFQYGNDLLVSGGPGRFLLISERATLSLQAQAAYEAMGRERLLEITSDRTGMIAWYLGPQLNFTWGKHFNANAGVDIPVHVSSNGFQSVPDYRVHGGWSWRF
jgi:hypothetical protein